VIKWQLWSCKLLLSGSYPRETRRRSLVGSETCHVWSAARAADQLCSAAVDERGLRELIALFRRYRVGLKQLAVFDRGEFADWFRSEQAYWHKEVFG
jgi:hypothetical protein